MPRTSINLAKIVQNDPNSTVSEAYRSLRFNIECTASDREIKTITITSACRGEGKTTTALNLAVAYAQIGKSVILLDADLRKPSLHLAFGGDNKRGLASFLANQNSVKEVIMESHIDNLSVIPAGPIPSNPSELLASKYLDLLLSELKQKYDLIIVDTPPVLPLTDAKILAAKCDGVLLVAEQGKVKRNTAKIVNEELMLAKANIIGVVWNKLRNKASEEMLYL